MERRRCRVVASECAGPEDLPDDSRVEHEALLVLAEAVQASGNDALERLRQGELGRRAALDVEFGELLGVQWVPAGTLEKAVWVSAVRTGVPSTLPSRCAVSSFVSGASAGVVALSFSPPQPGRFSSSSGRAVATTSRGTSVTQSTSSSTKSSRLSSAQWRSSNTTTSGRRSARPSRKRRHAENASLRRFPPSSVSSARPARASRCDSTHAAPSSGSASAAARRSFSTTSVGVSCSAIPACALTISASAHSVTQSP